MQKLKLKRTDFPLSPSVVVEEDSRDLDLAWHSDLSVSFQRFVQYRLSFFAITSGGLMAPSTRQVAAHVFASIACDETTSAAVAPTTLAKSKAGAHLRRALV